MVLFCEALYCSREGWTCLSNAVDLGNSSSWTLLVVAIERVSTMQLLCPGCDNGLQLVVPTDGANWWCRNSHQWDARSLRSRVTYTRKENKNTLQKAPVWSRPNTLRRLSPKSFYNSTVLERNQLRVPWCEEDVGAFIAVRSCLLSL